MKRVFTAFVIALFGTAPPAVAQVLDGALSGLAFGDGVDGARATLSPDCRSIRTFDLGTPELPIAEHHESHLICHAYVNRDGLSLDFLILRFADRALALIETRGAESAGLAPAEAESMTYGGFELHLAGDEVVAIDEGVAWVVPAEHMHPHPFYVPSPALIGEGLSSPIPMSVAKPGELAFGARLEEVREALLPKCAASREFEIDPSDLPTQPEKQIQIDCFGFPFAGFPRKVEAVFGDDVLELAWILTGKPEEGRIRAALTAEYGEPLHVDEETEVFGDGSVVLRKDKPEVLLLSPEMAAAFQARTP